MTHWTWEQPYRKADHLIWEVLPVRSGKDHTGKFKKQHAGCLGSPAGPAVSISTGSQVSATQSHKSLNKVLITGILWSPRSRKKLYGCLCDDALSSTASWKLISIFKIMCQTHESAVCLWNIYLHEKFTHSPMSQSLRASAVFDVRTVALFCLLKSRNHHEQWLHTARPRHTGDGSRNSVYDRKVYKYSIGKFMFKMYLWKPDLFCSQWQSQRYQKL